MRDRTARGGLGLISKVIVGSSVGFLGGCAEHLGGGVYRYGDGSGIFIRGENLSDGSTVYKFPREDKLQNVWKGALGEIINLETDSNGKARDIRSIRKFPDGSAIVDYYNE